MMIRAFAFSSAGNFRPGSARAKQGLAAQTPFRLAFVLVLGLLLSACAIFSPRTGPLAVSAASAGNAATDAALRSYGDLEGLYLTELRSRKTGDLLTHPGKPDYTKLATMSDDEKRLAAAWAESIETRRQAARNLQQAYSAFNRLAQGEFGANTEAAITRLNSAVSSFAAARGHPFPNGGPIPDFVGSGANLVIQGLQARAIRQHNRNLAELVRQFHALWDADVPAWNRAIDGAYVMELPPSLLSLSDSDFDQAAVGRLVTEPLSQPLKMRLYRMKILSDATSAASAAKAPLADVSEALRAVEHAHEELAKDQPSITDVLTYVDHAIELSKSVERESANAGSR
jgi:hypothetical protein